jgi:hypothetical protein
MEANTPKIGETVKIRLFADRVVSGKVVHVWEDAEGTRVRVVCGSVLHNVMLAQVVR